MAMTLCPIDYNQKLGDYLIRVSEKLSLKINIDDHTFNRLLNHLIEYWNYNDKIRDNNFKKMMIKRLEDKKVND